jgi:NAD(P)-dependent dehydrogenase (short-subunit alcohol dehydrogenase family)
MNSTPGNYIVFGGSGGIGSALVRLLRDSGHTVCAIARNEERLRSVGGPYVVADVTDSEQVNRAFVEARGLLGPVHGVAHCVGTILLKPAHLISDVDWDGTLQVNLSSAFYVLRAALREFLETPTEQQRSVVLVSSSAARIGLPNHEAIAAAKAGIIGLVKSAAATYASKGIRVNGVAPGLVRTPLAEKITSQPAAEKFSLGMHPLGRLGEPGDVAEAIRYLLDTKSSWVTGEVLGVDGGLSTLKLR